MAKLVNNKRDQWEKHLPIALTAYNYATSTTTGHTLYFLHHCHHAKLPLYLATQCQSPLEGWLSELAEGLQQAREMMLQSLQHTWERLAKKAKDHHIEVGDMVVIKAHDHDI